jgi:hypothetical protein
MTMKRIKVMLYDLLCGKGGLKSLFQKNSFKYKQFHLNQSIHQRFPLIMYDGSSVINSLNSDQSLH